MYEVKFDTGETVSFKNQPTDADIEEVVKKLGIKPKQAVAPQPSPEQKKTVLERAGGITDALFGGGKIGEAIGTKIAEKSQAGQTLKQQESQGLVPQGTTASTFQQPTKGQLAGSALQSASLFIPAGEIAGGLTSGARALGISKGASAFGKIATGGLVGEAFDVASNLQEGKTGVAALEPGSGALIGGALPAIGVAKNVAVRFGQDQAPRIINSLIKPLAKDFSYGKNPGRAVAEAKIVARDFEELATKIRESRQAIGQEIGTIGRKLSTKPIVDIGDALLPLDEAMKTAASQNNPTLLQRLVNVKKAISTVLEPAVDDAGNITIREVGARKLNGLTFAEARDILGNIGDVTQFTGNPSDDKAVNAALKQVYGGVKQATLDVADSLDPKAAAQFRKLTEKYADLSSAEIATKYRDKIVERSNLVGISPTTAALGTGLITMIATGGAATPAIVAGLAGGAIDKLASTPGFKTRLAAVLSKKTPEEVNLLFQKIPALQKFFPKNSPITPGDRLLQTKAGQELKSGIVDYAKNPKLGASIEDVSKSPLLQEAKKYKSAEDMIVYRGGEKFDPSKMKTSGRAIGSYFSTDRNFAQGFTEDILSGKTGKGLKNVDTYKYTIKKGANIATPDIFPEKFRVYSLEDLKNKFGNPHKLQDEISKWALKNGFDVVDYTGNGKNMIILNPKIIK